jgi:hypothetical protein
VGVPESEVETAAEEVTVDRDGDKRGDRQANECL